MASLPSSASASASQSAPDLLPLQQQQQPSPRATPPRLFPRPKQLVIHAVEAATVTGAALGAVHGAQTAALRFRAEHTHKLPSTTKGWYLYHKSKNYAMMVAGVREGLFMAGRLGFWVGAYFGIEVSVERLRGGRKDFMSTTVAGLSVAGAFSLWNRFPLATAARTAKMGLAAGLVFGLAQDAVSLIKGERVAYVDFVLRKAREEKDAHDA